MSFFGKKKIQKDGVSLLVKVITIPEVFYGGADPVIYPKISNLNSKGNKNDDNKKKEIINEDNEQSFLLFFQKKSFRYIVFGILALGIIFIVSWYQFKKAGYFEKNSAVSFAEKEISDKMSTNTAEILQKTDYEQNIAVTTTQLTQILPPTTTSQEQDVVVDNKKDKVELDFPKILLPSGVDTDADDLGDMEEEVFATDSGSWDTDKDGYYDGLEVINLYNPRGQAPVKLIDSGLVAEYVNSTWKYRVYYPNSWLVGAVDSGNNNVLFSAITGDFVEVRISPKINNQIFSAWFASNTKGQQFTDLHKGTNRFQENYLARKDGMVAYFDYDSFVTIFIYHPSGAEIQYPKIFQMMVESFRPTKTKIDLPSQDLKINKEEGNTLENAVNDTQNPTSTESTDVF